MKFNRLLAFASLWMVGASASLKADVKLPDLFTDHMVLQRDLALPVWGWSDPREQVTVTVADQTLTTTANNKGEWKVKLQPLKLGAPLTLVVKGKNTLTFKDVLVGDVWLCAGQSNMTFSVWSLNNPEAEIAQAKYPNIRFFSVKMTPGTTPQTTTGGKWDVCSPGTVGNFSAVGYFFGRAIHQKLNIPIGLIHTSVPGTNGESWVSNEGLSADPDLKALKDDQISVAVNYDSDCFKYAVALNEWEKKFGGDTSTKGIQEGWGNLDYNDTQWKTVTMPADWNALGVNSGGTVWLRKSIQVPQTKANQAFCLPFGGIADIRAFWNGVELVLPDRKPIADPVQERGSKFLGLPCTFVVPANLVHEGKNQLAIRAFSQRGEWPRARCVEMNLPINPEAETDEFRYQVEGLLPVPLNEALASYPRIPRRSLENTATYLYNGMIHPLVPFGIRGVVWYQGENNWNRAYEYRKILPALITDWRKLWHQGDFPFYIVQIANFGGWWPKETEPGDGGWAGVREAQNMTAKSVPNTGLAVTIDLGDAINVHPKNKQDVGARLALLALNRTYGISMEDSGPVYESMAVEKNKIRIKFSHVDKGLVAKNGPLKTFAIAGVDKKFVWAEAAIENDTVVVSSPTISNPVAVRYAWASNPEGCNLYNSENLPASPFRTDDWLCTSLANQWQP